MDAPASLISRIFGGVRARHRAMDAPASLISRIFGGVRARHRATDALAAIIRVPQDVIVSPLETLFDAHRFEDRAAVRLFERSPEQRFDRMAFARKALKLLRIERIRVAVFPSNRLTVECGRELGSDPDYRWAMFGVPSDASARSIVLALSRLARVTDDAHGLAAALAAAELLQRAN